jgi:hypothetical protein
MKVEKAPLGSLLHHAVVNGAALAQHVTSEERQMILGHRVKIQTSPTTLSARRLHVGEGTFLVTSRCNERVARALDIQPSELHPDA